MNAELRLLRSVTTRLPSVRGMYKIADKVRQFYCRKPREEVIASVHGSRMQLDPQDHSEGLYLFGPQLYDGRSVDYLKRNVRSGDVFLDAGAYSGYYTLLAARLVGPKGSVLSVEADPDTFERLSRNVRLNDYRQVKPVWLGLAESRGLFRLGRERPGWAAGNSFLFPDRERGVEVPCGPLIDVVRDQGLDRIDFAKFDIEGFEYKVLRCYLEGAPRSLFPRVVLVEQLEHPFWLERAGGNAVRLLTRFGYSVRMREARNYILQQGL